MQGITRSPALQPSCLGSSTTCNAPSLPPSRKVARFPGRPHCLMAYGRLSVSFCQRSLDLAFGRSTPSAHPSIPGFMRPWRRSMTSPHRREASCAFSKTATRSMIVFCEPPGSLSPNHDWKPRRRSMQSPVAKPVDRQAGLDWALSTRCALDDRKQENQSVRDLEVGSKLLRKWPILGEYDTTRPGLRTTRPSGASARAS
jgi:hypothetical protein